MVNDADLEGRADPAYEQFFLVSPEKIAMIVEAAGIRPTDLVMEVGAGVGTVARHLPPCRELVVVELDERLIESLRENVPRARVLQGDALKIAHDVPCDILIGNLPTRITEKLFPILPGLSFRTAVLAVDGDSDLSSLADAFVCSAVTEITGHDFRPPQGSVSRIVQLVRR